MAEPSSEKDPYFDDDDGFIDELALERKQRHKWLKIILLIFTPLLIAGLISAPIVYSQFKSWRARNLVVQAKASLQPEAFDLSRAYENATAAYQIDPQNIEVQRLLATIYEMVSPADSLKFWEEVLANEQSTLDDRFHRMQIFLRLGKIKEFGQEMAWFIQAHGDYLPAATLRLNWLLSEGHIESAVAQAKELLARSDEHEPAMRLFLIQVTLRNPELGLQAQGEALLSKTLESQENEALEAARWASGAGLQEPLYTKVMLKLRNHPEGKLVDKLTSLAMQYQQPGALTETALYERAEGLFSKDNVEDLLVYLRWLNGNRLFAHGVGLITPQEATKRNDLFLVYLDLLAGAGQWEILKQSVEKSEVPIPEFFRSLFLTRYAHEKRLDKLRDDYWAKTLNAAKKEAEGVSHRLWQMQDYAHKMGWLPYERQVLEELVKYPAEAHRAYQALVQMEKAEGGVVGLLQIYRRMWERYSSEPDVINDYAYLRLLRGVDVDIALKDAQFLVREYPNPLAYRMTLALAYLKKDQPMEGIESLQGLSVNWLKVPAPWRVITAALLQRVKDADNTNPAKVQLLLKDINPATLLPEERALLLP